MNTILVPIDFSDVAKNALKFAVKIARPIKSKIILFHTIRPIMIPVTDAFVVYPEEMTEEEDALLNQKMDELIAFTKEQHVESVKIMRKGFLVEDIADLIKQEKIDLIVTGTHGAKGLEAFFFGTNSLSIFEKVTCPVLIIPAEAKYHSIKKIMYATDFEYGDIKEIEKLCKIAEPFNAEIIVSHVNTNPHEMRDDQETMDWFAEIGDKRIKYKNIVYNLLYYPEVIDALEKSIQKMDIDILCMSTTEKDFFAKLISKSNTKAMALHAKIPFMALHLVEENKLD